MSEKEAAAWAMFRTQAQTGADGQTTKKKAKKPATSDQATQANTTPASAPVAAASAGTPLGMAGALGLVVIFTLLLYVIYKVVRWTFRKKPKKSADGFEEADYGIPNCDFKETADGFTVTFRQLPARFHVSSMDFVRSNQFGMIVPNAIQNLTIGTLLRIKLAFAPTKVEVTKEAVIIDKKKLRRADFGNFFPFETIQISGRLETLTVLGYQYGNKRFKFGGAWRQGEGTSVASALNQRLRAALRTGAEQNPTPDALRHATPSNEFD